MLKGTWGSICALLIGCSNEGACPLKHPNSECRGCEDSSYSLYDVVSLLLDICVIVDLAKIDPTRKPDPNPPENSGF